MGKKDGIFDAADAPESKAPLDSETHHTYREVATHAVHLGLGGVNKLARFDWKERYWRFQKRLTTFWLPVIGQEINRVQSPDVTAHCCCILRADLLGKDSGIGVYIEFEV